MAYRSSQAKDWIWATDVTFASAAAMLYPLTYCTRLGIQPEPLQLDSHPLHYGGNSSWIFLMFQTITVIILFLRYKIFFIFFNSSIVDLQCANFCCTAVTIYICVCIYMYIYIHIHTHTFFPSYYHTSCSVTEIECSSLCYIGGPYCLSVLNVIVCIYWPQTPRSSCSVPPATTSLFCTSVSLFLFCR